ncbi:MAG: thiamine pyrophosphate-binding protein [Chloroflexi bacterium]|nr:thiamine pyrophosphate-binding protein [Chloroflexota bacterium]
MTSETGGDAIVRLLKDAAVDTVFGVISIHNISIFDAIAREGGIRLIASRGEAGAVNMADGYARASGRLGVAITSTGTGAGNACGSLIEAQTAGSPVLHLTGQIDSTYLDQGKGYIHEVRDQLTMLRGASKAAFRVTDADSLATILGDAIRQALAAPRGPVSVEIPIDIQSGAAAETRLPAWRSPAVMAPNAADLDAAAELLGQAQRPVIWAGGGVIAAKASGELTGLAERLGAAVVTRNAGRGSIPEDHPLSMGSWAVSRATWSFLESCDAALIVGSHLRGNETQEWQAPIPGRAVQIDVDAAAIGRSYPAEIGLVGDAKVALAALRERLPERRAWELPAIAKDALAKARGNMEQLLGPYLPMVKHMRARLPRDAAFVRDVTIHSSTWGNRYFPIYEPRTNVFPLAGGIGQGLAMAIGAQLAQLGRRVLCIAGDGGLMVNLGEMATAAELGLPVVLVLFNDGGYGVLRNIQTAQYEGRHIGVDLQPPEFQQLAGSMGWRTWRVDRAEAFATAFDEALEDRGGPTMVEVDVTAIGPVSYGGPSAR